MTDYLKQEIDRLDQKIAAVKKSLADRELAPLAEEELAKLQAQKQVLLAAEQTPQINQEDSIDSTHPPRFPGRAERPKGFHRCQTHPQAHRHYRFLPNPKDSGTK